MYFSNHASSDLSLSLRWSSPSWK